jgi:hypothetical protein
MTQHKTALITWIGMVFGSCKPERERGRKMREREKERERKLQQDKHEAKMRSDKIRI